MIPKYSLLIARKLDNEELCNISGQNIKYVEENYDSNGYKFFTREEKEKNKSLSWFLSPVEVICDGKLTNRYVMYMECFKTYGIALGMDLSQKFCSENICFDGTVLPGYFLCGELNNPLPIIADIIDAYKEANEDETKDYGIVFHTYDLKDVEGDW